MARAASVRVPDGGSAAQYVRRDVIQSDHAICRVIRSVNTPPDAARAHKKDMSAMPDDEPRVVALRRPVARSVRGDIRRRLFRPPPSCLCRRPYTRHALLPSPRHPVTTTQNAMPSTHIARTRLIVALLI